MHREYSKRQCLICFSNINVNTNLYYLYHNPPICKQCFSQFEVINKKISVGIYNGVVLFKYNDHFKKILFQYKGLYDEALAPIFLFRHLTYLEKKYGDAMFVLIPSSKKDNKKRGFVPNEEMFKQTNLNIFMCIYKRNNYKQTKQKDRSQIKNILGIYGGQKLYKKDIIMFDDVITSGHTMQCAIALVEKYKPNSISFIILSKKEK